tara:strand:+ start:199 stop:528 length:330 start_codon:yes stop_codon:yes gene_type:complete
MLLFLNIEIKSLAKIQVYVFLGVIFGIHYLYFQNGNRIIKKITKLKPKIKPKINLTNKILTILYVFGTISLFCFLANIGLNNYLFAIIGIGATIIIAHYFFGKRNEQFD